MDASTAAAPSATVPSQSAGSIPGVLAACKGSGGPTETLDQLLELDEALGKGHAQSWASQKQFHNFLLAFRSLAEVGLVEGCAVRASVRASVFCRPLRHVRFCLPVVLDCLSCWRRGRAYR